MLHRLSSVNTIAYDVISVLSRRISMKLDTNVHQVSGHCWRGFQGQGPKVKVTARPNALFWHRNSHHNPLSPTFFFLSEGQQPLFPSRITLPLESASQGTSPAYRSQRLITLIWSHTCQFVISFITSVLLPSITPSHFHSRLKTHLFHKSFPP